MMLLDCFCWKTNESPINNIIIHQIYNEFAWLVHHCWGAFMKLSASGQMNFEAHAAYELVVFLCANNPLRLLKWIQNFLLKDIHLFLFIKRGNKTKTKTKKKANYLAFAMFQLNNYTREKNKKEVGNVIVLFQNKNIMRACFWGIIMWIMGADSPQSSFLEWIELRQS